MTGRASSHRAALLDLYAGAGGCSVGYTRAGFTVTGVDVHGREHPDFLTPTRNLLDQTALPWVIENVPQAPMRVDLELCGSMFDLKSTNGRLIRHRWFEFGGPWTPPSPMVLGCDHSGKTVSVFGHGGHVYHGVEDWRTVMGIDWMTRDELAQAIPPAFTEYIGEYLLAAIEVAA